MERFFILDKFNTWYDWRLILTKKDVTPPEPKTNYVNIDGMDGSLDLSETLSGEVTYNDRTVSASFWTDYGTRKDRERLLRDIRLSLHGKKMRIIEPDDPDHYFYGRVRIKSQSNNLAYAEFTIEAVCDPWRYSINDITREVVLTDDPIDIVIRNEGLKTLSPTITVSDRVTVIYDNVKTLLTAGTYIISTIKLRRGVNLINVSGNGSVSFAYKEADL